jgi:hypothetical protein
MVYHIPSDEEILGAVKKVFDKCHTVQSQRALRRLVEKELGSTKKDSHVSEERLRLLVLNSSFVQVEIHTRDGEPGKSMNKCPVCGGLLTRVKNQTIYGGEVTLEFRCAQCGYWTGKKKKIPTLYVFHMK